MTFSCRIALALRVQKYVTWESQVSTVIWSRNANKLYMEGVEDDEMVSNVFHWKLLFYRVSQQILKWKFIL